MAHHPPPEDPPKAIRKRLVCFLSGFDPQGPPHYHRLYASEGAKQALLNGYVLTVGKRQRLDDNIAYWDVEFDGGTPDAVSTRYEFLRWDDVVRQHWPRGRWGLFGTTVFGSWHMWRNGVMWRTLKTSWPMFVAIATPGALLLLLGMLTLALGALALGWSLQGLWGLAAAGLALGLPLLAWAGQVAERRSHMGWLMRSLACLVRQGRGQTPELDARLDTLGAHVAAHLHGTAFDEVLLVGHSSGAMMAMSVMARALAAVPSSDKPHPGAPANASWSMLTLGHCTPLLSEQPQAQGFRAELGRLLSDTRFCWIDYGAPPDGCCFPLVDPAADSDVSVNEAQRPKLLNPRFAKMFSPARYDQIHRDKFRCHFQYMMAGEVATDYDFFAMTAGPQSLAQRHARMNGVKGYRLLQCLGGPTR